MASLFALTQRALFGLVVVLVIGLGLPAGADGPVEAVESITITVRDLDRALDFYQEVLGFETLSEVEVAGEAYEHLMGTFGLRMRVARMRLSEEQIELMEVLAPNGRPFPADMRSNDRWFQHIAIVVSDMARAYAHLRAHKVRHASSGPQTLPEWNPNAGGIQAFYFRDPDGARRAAVPARHPGLRFVALANQPARRRRRPGRACRRGALVSTRRRAAPGAAPGLHPGTDGARS
jgi:catechol 2,3-dioxygenase-like lactoylglutathione lyase family enzyme